MIKSDRKDIDNATKDLFKTNTASIHQRILEALHFTLNCYIQQVLNRHQEHMTAGSRFKRGVMAILKIVKEEENHSCIMVQSVIQWYHIYSMQWKDYGILE